MTDASGTTEPDANQAITEDGTTDAVTVPQEPIASSTGLKWTAGVSAVLAVLAFGQVWSLQDRISILEARSVPQTLFQPPADMKGFIQRIQASTVVIECGESFGSGWVIDLESPGPDADPEELRLDKLYPHEVITNHHVIADCTKTPGKVKATTGDTTFDAWLYSWDAENDFALVGIKQDVPALPIANEPKPGYWVMALGSPYGLEGSVSIGNVINVDSAEVVTTAPFNSGNSGGPLVNSLGRVVGTSSWTRIGSDNPNDWNVAEGIPLMCFEIVNCADDERWTWGYDISTDTSS